MPDDDPNVDDANLDDQILEVANSVGAHSKDPNQNDPNQDGDKPLVGSKFVIGIGSSAGGLEATRDLVRNLPTDINAAHVIVQHLSPQYKSLLATLVERETDRVVMEITDGQEIESGHIYVTPPNSDVVVRDGKLRLLPPSQELASPKPSVDRFFISLAEDYGEYAVGIVLSGTGTDGAKGIEVIRASGGITLAQDKETAKYRGMPMAAIETGCVDIEISPVRMATHLGRILSSRPNFEGLRLEAAANESPVRDLMSMLFAHTGVDFTDYKASTVHRRVARRMLALGIPDFGEYIRHCQNHRHELDELFRDLLISVTRFFRDTMEYEALKEILAEALKSAQDTSKRQLRIWVAGCATGEEAYSIAILLAEAAGGVHNIGREMVQIFATDINRTALKIARRGAYSHTISDDIPPELLKKYFADRGNRYVVSDQIKNMIMFSMHNMCKDPPFLNVDLISCRNVLIYFEPTMQRKVLAKMHFALRPDAHLFLGTAETVSSTEEMFRSTKQNARIFQPLRSNMSLVVEEDTAKIHPLRRDLPRLEFAEPAMRRSSQRQDLMEVDAFVNALGPRALLVSVSYRILRVFGDLASFIAFNENTRLSMSLEMLREDLAIEAKMLVSSVVKNGGPKSGLEHRLDGRDKGVKLTAYALNSRRAEEAQVVITFEDVEILREPMPEDAEAPMANWVRRLEAELDASREAHRHINEELETSNEELQALNEELQSANEELQSANVELETANEELQSTNEELITVNEELHVNTNVLMELADEQEIIIAGSIMPMLIVDARSRIKTASNSAVEFFDIDEIGLHPHLSQLLVPKGFPDLNELCFEALDQAQEVNHSFKAGASEFFVNIQPIKNKKLTVVGVAVFLISPDFYKKAMAGKTKAVRRKKTKT